MIDRMDYIEEWGWAPEGDYTMRIFPTRKEAEADRERYELNRLDMKGILRPEFWGPEPPPAGPVMRRETTTWRMP